MSQTIECPYCDEENDFDTYYLSEINDGGSEEIKCEECMQTFTIDICVDVSIDIREVPTTDGFPKWRGFSVPSKYLTKIKFQSIS